MVHLMLFIVIPMMWMVLFSLMETQDSTSGHLLQLKMTLVLPLLATVPASTQTRYVTRATPPPAFVGDDYFCDTGSEERVQVTLYSDDPLWDEAGCGPLNTCCSINTPPWFYK